MRHWLSIALSVGVLMLGLYFGKKTGDWAFVSRSGSLVVVVAVIFEAWPSLSIADPGKLPMWESRESHRDFRVSLVLVAFGTLIQGYGDIVAKMLLSTT